MVEVSKTRVPLSLRQLPVWLCWRYEQHEGEAKPRKVPYYPNGLRRLGKNGSAEDRRQLTTFGEARAAALARDMSGVGMALFDDVGLCALDFDECVEPISGAIPDEILKVALRSYAEYSPSGTGIRVILKGNLGDHRWHPEGHWGLDIFSTNGFVTMTGNALPGCADEIAEVDDFTRELCESKIGSLAGRQFDPDDFMAGHQPALTISKTDIAEVMSRLDPSMRYPEWIRVGMGLHHQYTKGSADGEDPMDGLDLWNEWSSHGSNYPAQDGYAILKNFWDRFHTDTPHPLRFASVIAMAKHMPAPKEVTAVLRAALVRPTPEEVFSRPPPLPPYVASPGEALQSPSGYEGRFRITSVLASIEMPPMDWHIRGIMPVAELGMSYGPSTVGKSFMALDMACCIAMGIDWHGNRVRQGKVLYVAAEGSRAFGHRVRGWCEHHGVDPRDLARNFAMLNDAPDIVNEEQTHSLINAIQALGHVDIMFGDTLARLTAGHDENSAKDMTDAIKHAQWIHQQAGPTVHLIHHPGKVLSLGARGSSVIRAALDYEHLLLADNAGNREVRISKMKDGDDGQRYGFSLDKIVLKPRANDAIDEATGDTIPLTSRIIRLLDIPSDPMISTKGLVVHTEAEKFVLGVLDTLPPGISQLTFEELLDAVVAAAPGPVLDLDGQPLERDTRRGVYAGAIEDLIKKRGRLRKHGKFILFS